MTDPSSNNNSELLSVAQTAKVLDVTRQLVHDLIKNGQIAARKLGRYYYIEANELEKYKNQSTGKPYQHGVQALRKTLLSIVNRPL